MPAESERQKAFLRDPAFYSGGVDGLGILPGDAPDDRYTFMESLRDAILLSLGKGVSAAPGTSVRPALFVRSMHPREAAKDFGVPSVVKDIDIRDPQQWEGRLVFTAQHGTGGWSVPLPDGDLNRAVERLIARDLGTSPSATVYPNERVMICDVEGAEANRPSLKLPLPVTSRKITREDVLEVLEIIRVEDLLTPAVCPPTLWADPKKYIPHSETERMLQWHVASVLRVHFRPILVEREMNTPVGRIDICMTDPSPLPFEQRHPVTFELKVLRSVGSTGKKYTNRSNCGIVAWGMRQAKAYRVQKHGVLGFLVCFDLRETKSDLSSCPEIMKAREKYYDERMCSCILSIFGRPEDAQEEIAVS